MDTRRRPLWAGFLFALLLVSCDDPSVPILSSESHLETLEVPAPFLLAPPFSPETEDYSLTVPNAVTSLALSATSVSPSAQVSIPKKNLRLGSTTLSVVVTAEDGSTRVYRVKAIRLPASASDATLASLTSPGRLVPTFSPRIHEYTMSVDHSVTSLAFEVMASNPNAQVTQTGGPNLRVGTNVFTFEVTPVDTLTAPLTYTVTVTRRLSSNSALSGLVASTGTLTPAFDPSVMAYQIAVPNSVTALTLTATPSGAADAVVTGGPHLAVGTNLYSIVVTAPDGSHSTYVVQVFRDLVKSSLSELAALSLGTSLSPPFLPQTLTYSAIVPNTTSSLTVVPTLLDPRATVVVTGAASLWVGPNTVTVSVTAQDGVSKTTYTIAVKRLPVNFPALSNNSSLSALRLVDDGTGTALSLSPPFSEAVTDYNVTLAHRTTDLNITATKASAKASTRVLLPTGGVAANPIDVSTSTYLTVRVQVTAEDGTMTTYRVHLTRLAAGVTPKSNGSALTGLTLSKGTLDQTFLPTRTAYSATLPPRTTSVTVVTTKRDSSAVVGPITGASGLVAGSNLISIPVTASDGTKTIYTVSAYVPLTPLSDATLASLSVAGTHLTPSFAPGVHDYSAQLPAHTASAVVTALPSDPSAPVVITGQTSLVQGANPVTISVTSGDGTNHATYNLTLIVAASTDASLASLGLSVAGVRQTLTPAFSPDTLSYTATLPAGATAASVSASATDADVQSVVGTGVRNLVVGTNSLNVVVTAQDGTKRTYTIAASVAAPPSADSMLSSLAVTNPALTLSPAFSPTVHSYTASAPSGTTTVSVSAVAHNAHASVAVTGKTGLREGANTVTVRVTSADGSTTTNYTITVTVPPSSDSTLSSLALTNPALTLSPAFSPTVHSYTAAAPSGTTAVSVSAVANNAHASVAVTGKTGLSEGANTVTVRVTSADGSSTTDYNITVTVAAATSTAFSGTATLHGTLGRGTASPYSTRRTACWVWVTDSQGAYVETLMYYPAPYPGSLRSDMGRTNSWTTANPSKAVPASSVDAISAATWKTTTPTRTFHWSFIKANGTKLRQGTYTFHAMLFEDGASGETHYTAQVTLGTTAVTKSFTASTPTHNPGTLSSGSVVYHP